MKIHRWLTHIWHLRYVSQLQDGNGVLRSKKRHPLWPILFGYLIWVGEIYTNIPFDTHTWHSCYMRSNQLLAVGLDFGSRQIIWPLLQDGNGVLSLEQCNPCVCKRLETWYGMGLGCSINSMVHIHIIHDVGAQITWLLNWWLLAQAKFTGKLQSKVEAMFLILDMAGRKWQHTNSTHIPIPDINAMCYQITWLLGWSFAPVCSSDPSFRMGRMLL